LTDRVKYSTGEDIQIFGNVYDERGRPVNNESITIQVKRLPYSLRPANPYLSIPIPTLLFTIMGQQKPFDDPNHQLVYKTSLFPINGSFLAKFAASDIPDIYNVTASLSNTKESSSILFQEEDPLQTSSADMLYLAVIFIFILLLVPAIGIHSMRLVKILSFISISGLVIFLLLGLVFADAEIGANSPIGLVLKHPTDDKGLIKLDKFGRPEQGGEWVINFGGNQRNNYADGIQIPVYVMALGLAGGYLRFLYETATKREVIMFRYRIIEKNVFDMKDDELFPKIDKENVFINIFYYLGLKKKTGLRDNPDQYTVLMQRIRRDEIYSQKRHFYLFEILKRLGLVLLSPILASAVWFFLVQLGVRGQTGIFVLGAVSFAVGLVTDEAVQFVIELCKEEFWSKKFK
jgi:hypothetical protein